jgi:hypothetical protein
MMRLLITFLLSPIALIAGLIPSQRDELTKTYIDKVRPPYTAALRTKDTDAFKASIGKMQELGQQISAANSPAIEAAKRYLNYTYPDDRSRYPSDIKSKEAARTWTKRMESIAIGLELSNQKLAAFKGDDKITPESIRAADAYLILLTKEIEAHHLACMAIR